MDICDDRPVLVSAVMHPQVITIDKTATVAEAIALMQEHHVRTLIIKPEDQQDHYGIVTVRDIVYQVMARRLHPGTVTIAEIMRSPCVVVYPDLTVYEAAQHLAEAGIQRAPVIGFSDYGDDKLLGILSISDIVMKFDLNALELDSSEEGELLPIG